MSVSAGEWLKLSNIKEKRKDARASNREPLPIPGVSRPMWKEPLTPLSPVAKGGGLQGI